MPNPLHTYIYTIYRICFVGFYGISTIVGYLMSTIVYIYIHILNILLYFDLRPDPKMLFQGDAPEGSDTFQWLVIERDRVGGLRLIIWDKVKVPRCHYSDAPEESDLCTA